MLHTLYVGGASSGKSLCAERCTLALGTPCLYVATLRASLLDDETRLRVARHKDRRGSEWLSVEAGADLALALALHPEARAVLLDSVGTWISGILWDTQGQSAEKFANARVALDAVLERLEGVARFLQESSRPVVVVSEEVGLGLVPTDPLARMFTEILGRANQLLAGIAQRVIFVSCGLELVLKNTGKTR